MDYMVMYKGEEMSFDDYLNAKADEAYWNLNTSKSEVDSANETTLATEYAVYFEGKDMSLDEYLATKECECIKELMIAA